MVKVWNPVTDVYDDYPLDPFAVDSTVVHDTGDETVAGVKTFTSDPLIPDEVYGAGWNGSLEVPTKNAVYDKIETIGGGSVDDTAYDATTWNGVTATAPSKNAVRDKIEAISPYLTFTRRVFQTLTDKSSFAGTTDEQWGTEEATFDDALLPKLTDVTVYASVMGTVQNTTSTSNVLVLTVEISMDGGATWQSGRAFPAMRDAAGSSASNTRTVTADHQFTGTVTGVIQARVVARCSAGAATAYDLLNGAVAVEVLVSP